MMNEYQQANEIARQLKQKRLRNNPVVGKRVHFELDGMKRVLTTAEAAQALNLSAQTLWLWSCKGTGPIQPVRIGGRLGWKVADIEALLNGDAL